MDNKNKRTKTICIIAAAVVVLIAAVVAVIAIKKKDEEAYRIIKIVEVEGTATVTREGIGEISAYENMVLESGDNIYLADGTMTLKLDEDKFVYVEPETEFLLKATGSSKNSKTSIELKSGAITNDIQNKLSDESSYEVNTGNSTMAVRGTVFRVEVVVDKDGKFVTKLTGFDGKVEIRTKDSNGVYSEPVAVTPGTEISVIKDLEKDIVEFETTEVHEIDYEALPVETLKLIEKLSADGRIELLPEEITIIDEIIEGKMENMGPFTVTFVFNGSVFGTQVVEKGELVTVPTLMPASSGSWDFDFSTPITEDTTIEWK